MCCSLLTWLQGQSSWKGDFGLTGGVDVTHSVSQWTGTVSPESEGSQEVPGHTLLPMIVPASHHHRFALPFIKHFNQKGTLKGPSD